MRINFFYTFILLHILCIRRYPKSLKLIMNKLIINLILFGVYYLSKLRVRVLLNRKFSKSSLNRPLTVMGVLRGCGEAFGRRFSEILTVFCHKTAKTKNFLYTLSQMNLGQNSQLKTYYYDWEGKFHSSN